MSQHRGILINGAFRPQRVTGQQRYAREIADSLLRRSNTREIAPPPDSSSTKAWIWAQQLPFRLRRGEYLLTLTSRTPILAKRHVPVIHDLFVLTNPEWFSTKYAASHAPILRHQLRTAAAVVAVSEPVAQQVRTEVKRSIPVVTAPNAPADVFRRVGSDEAIPRQPNSRPIGNERYFLSVGSQEPRKNLRTLVSAYARLPRDLRLEMPLYLVGAGNAIYAESKNQDVEGLVRLGYLSDADLALYYKHATAVYFPTLDEGFGLPIVEALAAGANVVASDIPVLRWVAGDNVTYLPSQNADAWSDDMLVRATHDEPEPESAKRARQAFVRGRYDWDRSAEAIHTLVQSL